jgi:hypothetical protein
MIERRYAERQATRTYGPPTVLARAGFDTSNPNGDRGIIRSQRLEQLERLERERSGDQMNE